MNGKKAKARRREEAKRIEAAQARGAERARELTDEERETVKEVIERAKQRHATREIIGVCSVCGRQGSISADARRCMPVLIPKIGVPPQQWRTRLDACTRIAARRAEREYDSQ